MSDRLSVHIYPVNVTPLAGAARQKLLARLDVMQRELNHVQTAITDMKRAVQNVPNSSLVRGVMNSRNWVLSIVMSHVYIQSILGAQASGSGNPSFSLELLFNRALKAGLADGEKDRKS